VSEPAFDEDTDRASLVGDDGKVHWPTPFEIFLAFGLGLCLAPITFGLVACTLALAGSPGFGWSPQEVVALGGGCTFLNGVLCSIWLMEPRHPRAVRLRLADVRLARAALPGRRRQLLGFGLLLLAFALLAVVAIVLVDVLGAHPGWRSR
jgi:hypothetical protein